MLWWERGSEGQIPATMTSSLTSALALLCCHRRCWINPKPDISLLPGPATAGKTRKKAPPPPQT